MAMKTVERPLISNHGPEKRWGDRALQNLEGWLTTRSVSEQLATSLVEGVWVFYSYSFLPTFGRHLPLAIAAREQSKNHHTVRVYAPSPETPGLDVPVDLSGTNMLTDAFSRMVGGALGPSLAVELELVTPPDLGKFELFTSESAHAEQLDYLGVFKDDLVEELRTVMLPGDVAAWLAAPNTLFAGRTPSELLNTDEDSAIRNMILAARHGTAA